MKSETQLCQALKDLWEKDFPLTRAMGMEVESFSDHVLTTRSSLEPYNTNTHGTAFGGSLYAIEALTAWSLLWLEMQAAGLTGSIIHASGRIEFARTIREDIVAASDFSPFTDAIERLKEEGKLRLTLVTEVHAHGELASRFEGEYTARYSEADR